MRLIITIMVTRIVFIKEARNCSGMMPHVILWLMGLNLRDIMPCVKALTLEWTIPIFYSFPLNDGSQTFLFVKTNMYVVHTYIVSGGKNKPFYLF